jgi:hypothetical protein
MSEHGTPDMRSSAYFGVYMQSKGYIDKWQHYQLITFYDTLRGIHYHTLMGLY